MNQRTKTVKLACGCETKVAPRTLNIWLQHNGKDLLIACGKHGQQKIVSADGPEALAKLFQF